MGTQQLVRQMASIRAKLHPALTNQELLTALPLKILAKAKATTTEAGHSTTRPRRTAKVRTTAVLQHRPATDSLQQDNTVTRNHITHSMVSTRRCSNITRVDTRSNRVRVTRTINTNSNIPHIKRMDMVTSRLRLMAHINTVPLLAVTVEATVRAGMDNKADMDNKSAMVDLVSSGDV